MCLCIYLLIYTQKLHVCGYIFTYVYTKFTGVCTPSTCVCAYIYIHVRQIHMSVCIYLHICARAYRCMHTCLFWYDTCLFLYMCVWVYICMWKDTVSAYRCSVCISKYLCTYLGLYVCVYVCTSIYMCMKRHRVCMQSVAYATLCMHTRCLFIIQAYMSVFASCLQVCFICVCRYIHIYMYARKTPWAHTDTLCADRNTCIRICVCVCVYVYTCIYIYI